MEVALAALSEASLNNFDEFMTTNVSDFSSFCFPTDFDPRFIHIPSSLPAPMSDHEDSLLSYIDHNMNINASECSWLNESFNGNLDLSQLAMCHYEDSSSGLMDLMCSSLVDEHNYNICENTQEDFHGNFDLRQAKHGVAKECADSEGRNVPNSKRKLQILESSSCTMGSNHSTDHLTSLVDSNQKKKCRVPTKNPRARNENSWKNEEKSTLGPSFSSLSPDDELNVSSPELNGGEGDAVSNYRNRKTKAGKVPATDPQSLYARKRRERINERLRVLQNLVPNGTKVDISTMLEEAVQYVKFLQHQIKLLSSDGLWMYAPIAYNGKNIGLGFDTNLKPGL